MTTNTDPLAALSALGFSDIEARVYAQLLSDSPATGYKVSHAIGKPTANTYKAIASLEGKGAVLVDDGESRLCRAVPPAELMARLTRQFRGDCRRAARALSAIESGGGDDRVYRIQTVAQVLERARAMLQRATTVVVMDVFPEPLAELWDAIEHAAARGVRVSAKVYGPSPSPVPTDTPHLEWTLAVDPEKILDAWPGQQLSIVADAEEHLLALLSTGLTAVHQAVWSGSTFLSCMHHNHVASEIMMTRLERESIAASDERPVGAAFDSRRVRDTLLLQAEPPGLTTLRRRFGPTRDSETPEDDRPQ